jgi:hypothetical protein
MRRFTVRRSWGVALGGLVALGVVTVVVGAPVVGSGPFSMPTAGTPPKDIWTGPASTRAGARVKATSGTVRVDATVSGVVQPLGQVSAGVDCVFEGAYDKLTLVGVAFPAGGQYEVRAPIDATSGDRLIGRGSITFASSGGSVGIHASDASMRRFCSVLASGGPVSLRATRTGADLVAIESGDWSFAILSATTAFFLAAPGAGTGAWEVNDVRAACGPFTGTSAGMNGDMDRVSLDGACPVRLTIHNPGPATVTLTYQQAGQAVVTETVAPSTTAAAAGALSKFEWTYTDPTPNRVTTVSLTAAIE